MRMCDPRDVLLRVAQGGLTLDEARILLNIRPNDPSTRWLDLLLEAAARPDSPEDDSGGG